MDPVLERWLNERGIGQEALRICGAEYEAGRIRWPRRSITTGEVIGWKYRDLDNGRFWGDPPGIPHAATRPLTVEDVLPATGAMICEGESDTMRLACTDLPGLYSSDVICIPGATAFPSEWVPLLRRYERVHVFADADDAGEALPNRLSSLVPGTRVVRMPRGHDVCSFLLEHPEEDLVRLYLVAPLHVSKQVGIRRTNLEWDDAASRDHRDKLVRILISDGVVLRPSGPREFKGLCPFHDDTSPSFSVNPEKGLYRCFSCEAAGDVIKYLKETRTWSFGEAMQYLREFS